jgi:ATP-binding cassette subfamily B protein
MKKGAERRMQERDLKRDDDDARPEFSGAGPFIRHYVKREAALFAPLALLVAGAASCAVLVQVMMKLLVDAMALGPDAGQLRVWQALGGFIALIAVESLLWRLSGWLGCRATIGAGVKMRMDLFWRLSGQSMRYFAENLAGSLGQRITSTAGNFGALMNTIVWRVVPPCFDFIGALIVFSTVDLTIAGALAAAVVLTTLLLIIYGERGRRIHAAYAGEANAVGGDLIDVIANMWSVKAFVARRRESARLLSRFQTESLAQRRSWMYTERARLLHDLALWIMAGLVLTYSLHLWSTGRITAGDVVMVSALTFRILHGSRDIALALVDIGQQFGFIDETLRVIAQSRDVRDESDASALRMAEPSIVFERVSFSYKPGLEVLHRLDFRIEAGQKVGIVGASGAGKSTIVALLQRLYDPRQGRILIGGQDIRAITQDSLREALAVVPQEVHLFHRSIRENIRMARPSATDDEVTRAAEAAQCTSFIAFMPEGYDAIVGERGVKLSGGQRQRIGIARALLKPSRIMLLDEATSALDTETEIRLQRAILANLGDRTLIAVAHRLSSLAGFDRILVISNGLVVEDGSFDQLRRAGGEFASMWRLQAEGVFRDDATSAEAQQA